MRFLLSVLLCCLPLAAHADTYQQFDLNATLQNGGTITGTVDLDLDSSLAYDSGNQTANLSYVLNGVSTPIAGNNAGMGYNHLGPETEINFDFGPYGTLFVLELPTTTPGVLAGFSGGICTGGCAAFNSTIAYNIDPYGHEEGFIEVTSGTFVADGAPFVSDTPEPTSLMLLGTAAALIGWRRLIA